MAFLSREQFLSKGKTHRSVKTVSLPELGGEIGVRCLPVSERRAFDTHVKEAMAAREKDPAKADDAFLVGILTRCLCDAGGKPLLSEQDAADLVELDWKLTEKLIEEIKEWNGLGEKAQEQAEKNSVTTPNDNGLPPRVGATG